MRRLAAVLLAPLVAAVGGEIRLRPPLWRDADDRPIRKPAKQRVSELYALLYNTWLRHLSPEYKALAAADPGALNVNAWDEVPDSSWFTNRIGRNALTFEAILSGLNARPPASPPWTVVRVEDEGYTPKLRVRDSAGAAYIFKFDPAAPERNSGAERIVTLISHAAGYHVPRNTIAYFRPGDLRVDDASLYSDAVGRRRRMTVADLEGVLKRLKPRADGRYRALASALLPGSDAGEFLYSGRRKDDPNDLIPHELRRELRGLYVIASWVNHADTGDKNTFDAYIGDDGKGFLRHYLIDFGSTLGSGDFTNGPYRVGHEYLFDGAATGRSLVTLGVWRRPWEIRGQIRHPEIGYYQAELFEPAKWKPNYPNLAFERMDDADAYWGAKIVAAFSVALIDRLAEAGEYGRPEATAYVRDTLQRRRDAIGRYWLDRITPLEDFVLEGDRLSFRDLAVERGFAEEGRRYRLSKTTPFTGRSVQVPPLPSSGGPPDRYGRTALGRLWIESERRDGGWALPVEVVLGRNRDSPRVEVLGWRHAAR